MKSLRDSTSICSRNPCTSASIRLSVLPSTTRETAKSTAPKSAAAPQANTIE
jgi:hypothetical protein